MSNTWPDSAVMMTLSAIAYSSDINGQLQNTSYATGGDWSVVWGPYDDSYGNLCYVAKSASTGNYALAIRGSETSVSIDTLYNWFYNLYVTYQSAWPYLPSQPQAMLSYGAYAQASAMTLATSNGQTLGDYLTKTIPLTATVTVTGHSLGGNLATVLASWISYQRGPAGSAPDPNTQIYTYAAPSAGNSAFALGFNARLPNSYRYWNSLDAIPHAWETLLELEWIYNGIGIVTPSWAKDTIDGLEIALAASELYYNSVYTQPNGDGTELTGTASSASTTFIAEVAYQHQCNVYLGLLGAPLIQTMVTPELSVAAGAVSSPYKGSYLPRPVLDKARPGPMAALPMPGTALSPGVSAARNPRFGAGY
jgi:triacylglycerol lipase